MFFVPSFKTKISLAKLPGITLHASNVSRAFTLICFMVADVVFINKTINNPLRALKTVQITEKDFLKLKEKVLKILNEKGKINLSFKETLQYYILIDMVSRCFVTDKNLVLEAMAGENLDMSKKEYFDTRKSFLHFAEIIVAKMNEQYQEFSEFKELQKEMTLI